MEPFDLEKAKMGAPLRTREGFRARIICLDTDNDRLPIVTLLKSNNGREYPASFTKKGRFPNGEVDSSNDLLMGGIRRGGWVSIYGSLKERRIEAIYNSKEAAMHMEFNEKGITYMTAVRVEWEE